MSVAGPIVVAGDVSIDWMAWPLPPNDTEPRANWQQRAGTRMVARGGGALLLTDLLKDACRAAVIGHDVKNMHLQGPDQCLHSLVDLGAVAKGGTRRVERLRGFSGPQGYHPPQPPLTGPTDGAGLLLLDDSGNGFRATPGAWEGLLTSLRPRRAIIKMARPLADGPLWDAIRHGPRGDDGAPDPLRLVVVVNADDLREEGVALSRRLSWERTAEDFVRQLASNGRLDTLVTCADLIVRFDCDGVIHHRGRSAEPPMLYFYPADIEGDFVASLPGQMIGMTAAFTAGLAAALAEAPDDGIDAGIRRGMTAARMLARTGFRTHKDGEPDYPRDVVHLAATPDPAIAAVAIPSDRVAGGERWSILADTLGDPTEAARRLVIDGPQVALRQTPLASIGDLVTADRQEIEAFRAIGNLLSEYLATTQTKPISIGVFGPPGAGKSFGVEQVAAQVARQAAAGRRLEKLEFNLSQFTDLADLNAAFHLVRDKGLAGSIPLVFFDEFDSRLETDLGWLRYFLAPMQDGRFLENGHPHPLGAAIFVFAGGTRPSFAEFSKPMGLAIEDDDRSAFNAAKGPDFVSRLRGKVDILGPDQQGPEDETYPLRRGFLLRSLLPRREKALRHGERIDINEGVLNALLTVPKYIHGVRSMEAVLAMSMLTGETRFTRADLPPATQLGLHVPAEDFLARVRAERLPDDLREALGEFLHNAYRVERLAIEKNAAARKRLKATDASQKDWQDLEEELRESSRLQADDIQRKLRRIGCYMASPREGAVAVDAFADDESVMLAELEHERFNAERLQRQWRLGPRAIDKRQSPFLVPWRDLGEDWKKLDVGAVKAIIPALRSVKKVVRRVR
jgi:hypothetical protein